MLRLAVNRTGRMAGVLGSWVFRFTAASAGGAAGPPARVSRALQLAGRPADGGRLMAERRRGEPAGLPHSPPKNKAPHTRELRGRQAGQGADCMASARASNFIRFVPAASAVAPKAMMPSLCPRMARACVAGRSVSRNRVAIASAMAGVP